MLSHFDIVSIVLFIAVLLLASSVQAGTVEVTPAGTVWTSTECRAPAKPAALAADPELPAHTINAHVAEYNDFARAQESYMQCLSREAQNDANATNMAIIRAAQAKISGEEQKVEKLSVALKSEPR